VCLQTSLFSSQYLNLKLDPYPLSEGVDDDYDYDSLPSDDEGHADAHVDVAYALRDLISGLGSALKPNLSRSTQRTISAERTPRAGSGLGPDSAGGSADSARGGHRRTISALDHLNPSSRDWARLARMDMEQSLNMAQNPHNI
jgi:hypothetical protein